MNSSTSKKYITPIYIKLRTIIIQEDKETQLSTQHL